ncbi:hypothetical protein [Halovivax limisalsi]|uniref:hypothetical protein n=1 Tax=Halovivax limisalsi TaxID=1453760 RepID=UPI001FFCB1F5|nr:hypothetical protein [Halovivax limisalsi]
MELVGRTLSERIGQALVVFAVFLAFEYYRGEIEWGYLIVAAPLFFVIMIGLDRFRHVSNRSSQVA